MTVAAGVSAFRAIGGRMVDGGRGGGEQVRVRFRVDACTIASSQAGEERGELVTSLRDEGEVRSDRLKWRVCAAAGKAARFCCYGCFAGATTSTWPSWPRRRWCDVGGSQRARACPFGKTSPPARTFQPSAALRKERHQSRRNGPPHGRLARATRVRKVHQQPAQLHPNAAG